MSLLALRDVALIRGGRLLFERMNLALSAGESVVLTGPNGIGKSSLIRVAAGLLRASGGEVERNGRAALADENAALDPRLPLDRALAFWARIDGVETGPAMQAMGLAHLAAVPVRMLSTGQRKRAVLARVIASAAPLWLLDEPLNGLDGDGQERLVAAAQDHLACGGAVLAASHQPFRLASATQVALG